MFEFWVALRFLFFSRVSRSVRFFSFVSILSIAFSVVLFILIDAVMTGFSARLKETLMGFEAPLFVDISSEQLPVLEKNFASFKITQESLELTGETTYSFDGLAQVASEPATGIKVRTIAPDFFRAKLDSLAIYWAEGYNKEVFLKSSHLVILGESLYERLPFLPGDEEIIQITHPFADLGPSGDMEPHEASFVVAGILSTGNHGIDDYAILMTPSAVLTLANPTLLKIQYLIFTPHTDKLSRIQNHWHQTNPGLPVMRSWVEKNQNLLKAMALEKVIFFAFFILMTLVSSFNLLGVVMIFGMSKLMETAILKTLGLTSASLHGIFTFVGGILGGLGGLLGCGMGVLIVWLMKTGHFELPTSYGFSELPLKYNCMTYVLLIFFIPLLSMLISLVPASRVVKNQIADVMRLA
jgi:lipoprotein-releasing system permease protein